MLKTREQILATCEVNLIYLPLNKDFIGSSLRSHLYEL
jgi:hypothetical protein